MASAGLTGVLAGTHRLTCHPQLPSALPTPPALELKVPTLQTPCLSTHCYRAPCQLCLLLTSRQKDTQKLAQQILQANDQRLMELRLHRHQKEETSDASTIGLGSCERAASAADLLRMANQKMRGSARVTMQAGAAGQQHFVHSPGSQQQASSSSSSSSSRSSSGTGTYRNNPRGTQQGLFGVGPVGPRRTGLAVGPLAESGGDEWRLQPAAVAAGADAVSRAGGGELKDVPFEMLVLEILLDATAGG